MAADILQFPGPICLVVTLVCSAIMISLLIHLIIKTRSKLPKLNIVISYVAIIFYSLYAVNQFILSIYSMASNKDTFDGNSCYYLFFTPLYFLTGKIFTFIFYLARLYSIFKGTTYEYNKTPLQIFGIFIIVGYYSSIILFVYIVVDGLNKSDISAIHSFPHCADSIDYRSPTNILLASIAIMLNLLMDLAVTIITLRLYLKKLMLLSLTYDVLQLSSINSDATDTVSKTDTIDGGLSDRFYVMTLKTTFLFIITILTGYLNLVINGAGIGEYWLSIDHTVNVFCIYLSYGFSKGLYDKLCGYIVAKYFYQCCAPLCFCCCRPKKTEFAVHTEHTLQRSVTVPSASSGTASPKSPSASSPDSP